VFHRSPFDTPVSLKSLNVDVKHVCQDFFSRHKHVKRQTPNYRSSFDTLRVTNGTQIVVRNVDLQAQDKLYNRNKDGL